VHLLKPDTLLLAQSEIVFMALPADILPPGIWNSSEVL
jgi:hypothetical protein